MVSTQAARARSQAARAASKGAKVESVAQVSFGEEYHYVITDLRNMGLLAAAMFALLAILALIFYAIIKARVTRSLAMVEQLVHSIADHIKREADGGPR